MVVSITIQNITSEDVLRQCDFFAKHTAMMRYVH